jgi:ABC-type uncharacterized transport system ATPase subunit
MASLLLSRYDVFLLDEPTNDLDLEALEPAGAVRDGLRAATCWSAMTGVPGPHGDRVVELDWPSSG